MENLAKKKWKISEYYFLTNEYMSPFCDRAVTVSQPKCFINAIRAGLWLESGATVRKNNGNSDWSDSAGAIEPNDTWTIFQ